MSISDYIADIERHKTMPWIVTKRHFKCMKRLKREVSKSKSLRNRRRRDLDLETISGIRRLICEGNLRLVLSCLKKYKYMNPKLQLELIADGNLGLIDAVDGFDVYRGYRFSTYACNVIKSRMRNILNEQSMVLKRSSSQRLGVFITARTKLQNSGNVDPTDQDIADWLNTYGAPSSRGSWKEKAVALMRSTEIKQKHCSLDITNDYDNPLLNILETNDKPEVDKVDNNFIWESVKRHSTPKEFDIIYRRFVKNEILDSVGKSYNITRERIRQIESSVFNRMKLVFEHKRINIIPLNYLINDDEKVLMIAAIARWSSYPDPPPDPQPLVDCHEISDQPSESYEVCDPMMVEHESNMELDALLV